jgi:hypothetical protein
LVKKSRVIGKKHDGQNNRKKVDSTVVEKEQYQQHGQVD